jgi:hypothetical protein
MAAMRKGHPRFRQQAVKRLTGIDALIHMAPAFGKPLKAAIEAADRGELMESMRHFATAANIDPTNKALLHFAAPPLERAYFALKYAENPPDDNYLAQVRSFTWDIVSAAAEAFPDDPIAVHNVGKFLQDDGDDEGSVQWYRRGLALKRDQVESWGNLGTALYQLGHADEAEVCWSRCVAFPAENASGLYTQGFVWLRRGDYIRGWPALNARWEDRTFGQTYGRKDLLGKPWTGQPLRKGESLLVHGEQGFGDHVQFARYIPPLLERGIRIAGVETRAPLTRWFEQCLSVPVVVKDQPLPKYTHHVPMMSLPGLLKCWDAPKPLTPISWKPLRLTKTTNRRIGIVWAGTRGNQVDRVRSMPAELLGELADLPGITWVPLQYDPSGVADLTARAWLGKSVEASPSYQDALGLAEVMAGLDAVVTVDTLAAHIAGSIGVPTYVLHRFSREWRWSQHTETTAHYPSHVMLTQPAPDDWTSLVRQLRERLLGHQEPAVAPLVAPAALGEVGHEVAPTT